MGAAYTTTVVRTLVSAIANITNNTIGSASQSRRMLSASTSFVDTSTMNDDSMLQRITIAKSLSQVTAIIRVQPEIISIYEKQLLK